MPRVAPSLRSTISVTIEKSKTMKLRKYITFDAFLAVMLLLNAAQNYQIYRIYQNVLPLRQWRAPITLTVGGDQNAIAAPLRDGAELWRMGADSSNGPTAQGMTPTTTQTSEQ